MAGIGRIVATVISAVILAPLSFCVVLPIGINELKAAGWGFQYGQMSHPEGTERIWLRQGVEKLSNGDNCDFVLFEARSYAPGDEASIRAFYAERPNPIDPRSNPLRPEFFDKRPAPASIVFYDAFYADVARLHTGPYYMLEAMAVVESGPPLIDFRCP